VGGGGISEPRPLAGATKALQQHFLTKAFLCRYGFVLRKLVLNMYRVPHLLYIPQYQYILDMVSVCRNEE
jgi:hypothetical protein